MVRISPGLFHTVTFILFIFFIFFIFGLRNLRKCPRCFEAKVEREWKIQIRFLGDLHHSLLLLLSAPALSSLFPNSLFPVKTHDWEAISELDLWLDGWINEWAFTPVDGLDASPGAAGIFFNNYSSLRLLRNCSEAAAACSCVRLPVNWSNDWASD